MAKKVSYELIRSDENAPIYATLNELVADHHDHLRGACIALAWCTSWKADVDGRLKLGQCKKVGELDRDLHGYDFIILLNQGMWQEFTPEQQAALLDHELCHAEITIDDHGAPVLDERGRIVYRLRKHDVEEFRDVIKRHGIWKHDLMEFAQAVHEKQGDLFAAAEAAAGGS